MASSRKQINVETDAGGINVCVNSVKRDRRDSEQTSQITDQLDVSRQEVTRFISSLKTLSESSRSSGVRRQRG